MSDVTMEKKLLIGPMAMAKIQFMMNEARFMKDVEISGFGISPPDNLLYVMDFMTVLQENTGVSTEMDDEAVGKYFDAQVNAGRQPREFARIWIHTHPGFSAEPSNGPTGDENTMENVFADADWRIMVIVANRGVISARMDHVVMGGMVIKIPLTPHIDWIHRDFGKSDHDAWRDEFNNNIHHKIETIPIIGLGGNVVSNKKDGKEVDNRLSITTVNTGGEVLKTPFTMRLYSGKEVQAFFANTNPEDRRILFRALWPQAVLMYYFVTGTNIENMAKAWKHTEIGRNQLIVTKRMRAFIKERTRGKKRR